MENKLFQDFIIPCYATDASCLLRPDAFMDYAQEIANVHADKLGFGYDDLQQTRTAWVLSRMHVRFMRHPRWREKVRLGTWHKGAEGLFYLRDFTMSSDDGETLVTATTSWLVLDIDTRRIRRGASILDEGTSCKENAVEVSCPKIQMNKEIEASLVSEHIVSYTDVDMNGHTNNARYVVWAMDSIDYSVISGKPLREMIINFNHETVPGDVVELRGTMISRDGVPSYDVEGRVSDRQAFCVRLVF